MRDYALKTKCGEVINTIRAHSIDIAEDLFSKRKKLNLKKLLEIYVVEELY